jgi:hypothetical protein
LFVQGPIEPIFGKCDSLKVHYGSTFQLHEGHILEIAKQRGLQLMAGCCSMPILRWPSVVSTNQQPAVYNACCRYIKKQGSPSALKPARSFLAHRYLHSTRCLQLCVQGGCHRRYKLFFWQAKHIHISRSSPPLQSPRSHAYQKSQSNAVRSTESLAKEQGSTKASHYTASLC